jgi:hypothetical protein
VEIPLAAATTRRLTIVGEDGSPVAGVTLRLRSPTGEPLQDLAASERILVPAGEEDALLEVSAPDHPTVLVPLEGLPGRLALPSGHRVAVRALDEHGRPLPGAEVTVRYDARASAPLPEPQALEPILVEHRGRGSIALPAGRAATVLVEAPGREPVAVDVPEGRAHEPLAVTLPPAAPLEVRVVGADGAPLPRATVKAFATSGGVGVLREARTDAEGRARVDGLPPPPFEVFAVAPGHAWAVLPVSAAGGPVEVRLARGGPLRLVVEDPLGLPLAGARVWADPSSPGPADVLPPDASPWRTDARGTLVAGPLSDRPYDVHVALEGHGRVTLRRVTPGEAVHFVTLVAE